MSIRWWANRSALRPAAPEGFDNWKRARNRAETEDLSAQRGSPITTLTAEEVADLVPDAPDLRTLGPLSPKLSQNAAQSAKPKWQTRCRCSYCRGVANWAARSSACRATKGNQA